MEKFWQDFRYGLRMLTKSPGFTLVAILALALGIGANSAIFSIVNAVLLRPLPYKDSDRLVMSGISLPDYKDLKENNQVFDEMAVYASNLYNLIEGDSSEQVLGGVVSDNFLSLLGSPLIGRPLQPEDNKEQVVVLSHKLWQRRFGGDKQVLGKSLNLGGETYTIVGVMGPEFQFPNSQFELWVPIVQSLAKAPQQAANRKLRIFRAVAHLKPGVTLEQAQADINKISEVLEKQYPDTNAGVVMRFVPIYQNIVGDVKQALLILLGTVGFILLIACANIANLLLARTTAREREIAVRVALGAGRWRVARQLLTESVMLASIGGAFGLLIAFWAIDLLPKIGGAYIPRVDFIKIDPAVLLFTLGASMLTGILFGLAPALQASKTDLIQSLNQSGRDGAGGTRGKRLRGALVIVEVALSVVVLVGAGLLIKSFSTILQADPGFKTENLLTMSLEMVQFKEPQQRAAILKEVVEKLSQIPNVEAAGGGTGLPPRTGQRITNFEVEGLPDMDKRESSAFFVAVTPDYFRALGTPLIRGRVFSDQDNEKSDKFVIVNQNLARRISPDGLVIGRKLKLVYPEYPPEWRTIVGVVGNVKYSGMDDDARFTIFTPFSQTPFLWSYITLRTKTAPATLTETVRKTVSSINSKLIAAKIQPMEQIVYNSVAQPRFNALLISIFAGLGLLLAAVGIYGVISYSVAQRTREIGIRIALGAQQSDVLKLVVRQGILLTLTGIIIGIAAAIAVTRVMESLLFKVSTTDPFTFIAVSLILLSVAIAASYIPARKAMKVDPMVALRYE